MKTFGLYEKDLKKGYIFDIDTIDQIDKRNAEVSFEEHKSVFRIWFNGALIHSCKTFKSVINRLNKLDSKFPLFDTSEIQ